MSLLKKFWIPISAACLLLTLIGLSLVRVPADHFAIAGSRELAPGWHWKPFWLRARIYADSLTLTEHLFLQTREGARKEAKVTAAFAWDREGLKRRPGSEAEVRRALAGLAPSSGAALKAGAEKALAAFPIRGLTVSLDMEGELPDEVKAAWHPTHRKIVLLGLDAMDWILMDKLIARGEMPTFARLKREGAWADEQSYQPLLSPLIWTSIATSRPPEEHGILEFVAKDPATGAMLPVASTARKVQAFWNILSAFKLKVNVVGWWATFPAEKISGTMVSERLFFSLFGIETPKDVPGNTYPPDAEKRFKRRMVYAQDIQYPEIREYVHITDSEYRQDWEEGQKQSNPFDNRINHLRKILAVTHSVVNISEELLEQPFDVTAIYLEGPDTVGHRFAHLMAPKLSWVSESDFEMGKDALPRYYKEMDRVLADLMKKAPSDTLWIIASDHGFFTGDARPTSRPDDFTTGAPEWHRLTGVLILAGPGVRPMRLENATIYDLIPTMFDVLGVPASREWKGRALTEAFASGEKPSAIASYEFLPTPWKMAAPSAGLDKERIKELQALGYIEGAPGVPAPKSAPPAGAVGTEEDSTQIYNKANILYQKGELDQAMDLFRKAVDLKPDFSLGMFSLAQCYAMKKDHEKAYGWLKKSLQYPKMLPPKILVHLVDEAKEISRTQDALAFLAAIEPTWRGESSYYVALGIAHAAQGDETEAVRLFEQALRMKPDNAVASEELLKRYIEGNQTEKAHALLRQAWSASEGSIQTMNYLGIVCLRNGQGKIAEGIFTKVLDSDPGNAGVSANLAIALQMQGRNREAAAAFEKAVRLQPDNGQLHYNYGACLAEMGRSQQALDVLLKARALNFKNPKLFVALGKVYFRLGRTSESASALREGLELDPNLPGAREMLEDLEKH